MAIAYGILIGIYLIAASIYLVDSTFEIEQDREKSAKRNKQNSEICKMFSEIHKNV